MLPFPYSLVLLIFPFLKSSSSAKAVDCTSSPIPSCKHISISPDIHKATKIIHSILHGVSESFERSYSLRTPIDPMLRMIWNAVLTHKTELEIVKLMIMTEKDILNDEVGFESNEAVMLNANDSVGEQSLKVTRYRMYAYAIMLQAISNLVTVFKPTKRIRKKEGLKTLCRIV
ncbi:hypothetical protein EDC96DRAFT_549194 [Choanephora cucurbitarum]|nr:hypothetical protein EDC96DRAFT_549194 [Choanephora cucurbitarum]